MKRCNVTVKAVLSGILVSPGKMVAKLVNPDLKNDTGTFITVLG